MKIDDPITLARSCRTAHQAARAMAALEAEISLADRRSEDWYLEADCAIDYLRQRFPDARQLDVYTQAPSLSPGARRVLRNGRADTAGGRSSSTTLPGLSVAVRRHPWAWRGLELGALLAAIAAALVLFARHLRRHPRHAATLGVAALAATGHPVLASIGVGFWVFIELSRFRQRLGLGSGDARSTQSSPVIRSPRTPRAPRGVQAPSPPRIRNRW